MTLKYEITCVLKIPYFNWVMMWGISFEMTRVEIILGEKVHRDKCGNTEVRLPYFDPCHFEA